MTRLAIAVAALLATVFASPQASASDCLPADAGKLMTVASGSNVSAAMQTKPSPVTVGVRFAVDLRICGKHAEQIDRVLVDATMPAHRHGMNYRPKITFLGAGQYRAEGLLFHMPGRWQYEVTVFSGERVTRLTLDTDIR